MCAVRVRMYGRDDLLNVQSLEAIIIVNTVVLEKKREEKKRGTYWFQCLDEQPFIVGNIILERSL